MEEERGALTAYFMHNLPVFCQLSYIALLDQFGKEDEKTKQQLVCFLFFRLFFNLQQTRHTKALSAAPQLPSGKDR